MNLENTQNIEFEEIKERSPDYLNVLSQIELILVNSPERKNFIEDRVVKLSKDAKVGELSHIGSGVHKGFLGPQMEVRRNMIVDPIIIDDFNLYETLLDVVNTFKSDERWKDKSLREIIPNAIQWTLTKYFGNAVAYEDTEQENRDFYMNHISAESSAISISEFKEKGFAVCAEKAAVAQNLLAFVGLESDLIASAKCKLPAESKESAHYYIVLHGPKGEMIYDPANHKLFLDSKNRLLSYGPAFYGLTQEQLGKLMAGESMEIDHTDTIKHDDSHLEEVTHKRIYAGPGLR